MVEPNVTDPRPPVEGVYRNHVVGCILPYEHPGGCEISLQPEWLSLAKFFATSIATGSVDKGKEFNVLQSYTDIVRYLTVTAPDDLKQLMDWLSRR
jgi:hypothetical protein